MATTSPGRRQPSAPYRSRPIPVPSGRVDRRSTLGTPEVDVESPVIGRAVYPQDLHLADGADRVGEPEVDETAAVTLIP